MFNQYILYSNSYVWVRATITAIRGICTAVNRILTGSSIRVSLRLLAVLMYNTRIHHSRQNDMIREKALCVTKLWTSLLSHSVLMFMFMVALTFLQIVCVLQLYKLRQHILHRSAFFCLSSTVAKITGQILKCTHIFRLIEFGWM